MRPFFVLAPLLLFSPALAFASDARAVAVLPGQPPGRGERRAGEGDQRVGGAGEGRGHHELEPRERGKSMKFFADRGHRQVVATYYDDTDLSQTREWIETARDEKSVIGYVHDVARGLLADGEVRGTVQADERPMRR